jgi:hypothetical protein
MHVRRKSVRLLLKVYFSRAQKDSPSLHIRTLAALLK